MACLEAKHVPIKNIWYVMERKDKGGPKPKMQNPPLGFFFFFFLAFICYSSCSP